MSSFPDSCYARTGGLFYFARMCSKIRLHAAGQLDSDYFEMKGDGFDARTCRYLGVEYAELEQQVLKGLDNEAALQWCYQQGSGLLTQEQILIYNSFMSKRGWRDDETDEFIPDAIRRYGLEDDGNIITDFDLIEKDEGRWYPDQWRDAWTEA